MCRSKDGGLQSGRGAGLEVEKQRRLRDAALSSGIGRHMYAQVDVCQYITGSGRAFHQAHKEYGVADVVSGRAAGSRSACSGQEGRRAVVREVLVSG